LDKRQIFGTRDLAIQYKIYLFSQAFKFPGWKFKGTATLKMDKILNNRVIETGERGWNESPVVL
jgi:hypothetical protein